MQRLPRGRGDERSSEFSGGRLASREAVGAQRQTLQRVNPLKSDLLRYRDGMRRDGVYIRSSRSGERPPSGPPDCLCYLCCMGLTEDDRFMRLALEAARQAAATDDV